MARPKKTHPIAREHKFTIRLSPEEDELLDSRSEKAGLSRAEYMRSLIYGKTPSIKYEIVYNSPEILKIFSNLANITGNLNQIAHHLNAGRGWTDELRREVNEAIYEVREMRKELKELAGNYRGDC